MLLKKVTDSLKSFFSLLHELLILMKGFFEIQQQFTEQTLCVKDTLAFLNVSSKDELYSSIEETQDHIQKVEISCHLLEFLKKSRFSVINEKNYSALFENVPDVPKYESMSLNANSDQLVSIPWRTCLFIEDPSGLRLVVRVCFDSELQRPSSCCFYAAKENEGQLLTLISKFKAYRSKNSIYRNQQVVAVAGSLFEGLKFKLISQSNRTFDSLIIEPELYRELKENIIDISLYPERYSRNGIPLKRGVIFSGPPGCGKSSTIQAICSELAGCVTIIFVSSQSVTAPSDVSRIYFHARQLAPSLVIFEDVDLFGGDRQYGEYSPIIGELLNQLDGVVENTGVITIATTNYLERLDNALKNRPARFDRHLIFSLPDLRLRKQLFQYYLAKHPHEAALENQLEHFCHELGEVSSATIQEVVISAVFAAMEEFKDDPVFIRREHIETGIQKVKGFITGNRSPLGFYHS
jgi:AAA+ superfamily predicted ATPase